MNFSIGLQANTVFGVTGNQQADNSHLGRPRALQRLVPIPIQCNTMQQSQAYNKTWRSISGSVTDYAFALAESTLTNHFQYTKMRSRYQIRALTVQGTKKI